MSYVNFFGDKPPSEPPRQVPAASVPAPTPPPAEVTPIQRAPVTTSSVSTLDEVLTWVADREASDLHLSAGRAPHASLDGQLVEMSEFKVLTVEDIDNMLQPIMSERHRAQFAEHNDTDLAYALGEKARFRVNVHRALGKTGAVMRLIPTRVRTADELDLSAPVRSLAAMPRGLVLVTGPTGSGKTTFNAAMVDLINRSRRAKVVTIEDPVEFVHTPMMSDIVQRQVGDDTNSFSTGVRAALRQAPDVILVGEMRDLETTRAALEASETGHLVFGTMHTNSAAETVSRVVNQFPDSVQNQIQATLASSLAGVITQTLVPKASGQGRVAARETMIANDAIRAQIRAGKLEQIQSTLQTSSAEGMNTLNADLARLVQSGEITLQSALSFASDPDEVNLKLGNHRKAA